MYVEFLAFALVAPARIIRWEMEATSILTRGVSHGALNIRYRSSHDVPSAWTGKWRVAGKIKVTGASVDGGWSGIST